MIRPATRLVNAARTALLAAAVLLAAADLRAAVQEEEAPGHALCPPAPELLSRVVAALPAVPLTVTAQLQSRTRTGEREKTLNAEMRLDWCGHPPSARYTVRDAFGEDLEALHIEWRKGRRTYRHFAGAELEPGELTDLQAPVQGTDVSWTDLSLSFLWWPGGETVGAEKIKGRTCCIVDLPAPPDEAGAYAGVRLWIDPQINLLLQAAAYDAAGEPLRLLEVKSFKKIRDVWVIQNIDIQTLPSRHRTQLRVKDVDVEGEEAAAGTAAEPRL